MIVEIFIYFLAALFEIAGCFAFWMFFKCNKNWLFLVGGLASLILFAFMLTRVESEFAGRAYAIYGGIYIFCSLLWLYFIERQNITKMDIIGACVSIFGALIIFVSIFKKA